MNSFISSWQHLPEKLEPIAFTIGFISIYWYAILFVGGFLCALSLAFFLVRKKYSLFPKGKIEHLFFSVFLGALIGGKIGYILFYNFPLFLSSPLSLLSPYDFVRHSWTGISGMSYHGGLIGSILALSFFAKEEKISFWRSADLLALCISPALFFGRLGNFLNGELYGRVTEMPWGMFFPTDAHSSALLRHPSSLYEAFFEGIGILVLLLLVRRKMPFEGALSILYLALYGSVRFGIEYFREPDPQIGLLLGKSLSLGQIFSFMMFCFSLILFFWFKQRNCATIKQIS